MTNYDIERLRLEWAKADDARDFGCTISEQLTVDRDIPYCSETDNSADHMLDVYCPLEFQHLPIILNIHGGAWFYGDKERYRFYAAHLAENGFLVVNCNYRRMPDAFYPAPLEDVCAVVKWMQTQNYTDNPNWFMVGDSAGAQLVTQYCILASNPEYRMKLGFPDIDALPNAIALNCGIYDMRSLEDDFKHYYIHKADPVQKELFDNMLDYITAGFPPTFLMQAYHDGFKKQTKPMREKLEMQQIPMVFREYGAENPADGHVFHLNLRSKNGLACNAAEIAFFQTIAGTENGYLSEK